MKHQSKPRWHISLLLVCHTLLFFFTKPNIVGTHFQWHNKIKSLSSFIVGTSPEFDLAMYTVCFFVRQDGDCRFSMAGHNMDIKSYTVPFGSYRDLIATAYVNWYSSALLKIKFLLCIWRVFFNESVQSISPETWCVNKNCPLVKDFYFKQHKDIFAFMS